MKSSYWTTARRPELVATCDKCKEKIEQYRKEFKSIDGMPGEVLVCVKPCQPVLQEK